MIYIWLNFFMKKKKFNVQGEIKERKEGKKEKNK